jgi:hypothetical protein
MAIDITTADSTTITGIRNALNSAPLSGAAVWDSAYTTTNVNSAGWESTESTLSSNSAGWSSVYSLTQSNSAGWESTETSVNSNSARWGSVYSTTQSNSATWSNPVSNTVLVSSSNVILSACTITTYLSVGGIIYSKQINTVGAGTPTLSSGSDIQLDAVTRVTVTRTPFRLANFTETERNNIAPLYGDIIYNTTSNTFQGYTSLGFWADLS